MGFFQKLFGERSSGKEPRTLSHPRDLAEGDIIKVETPGGSTEYEIQKVEYI